MPKPACFQKGFLPWPVDTTLQRKREQQWRRGVQDHDYLTLAAAVNPAAVQGIVEQMIPRVVWELGVSDPKDPTWVKCDISWSTDPDVWEAARAQLAEIITKPSPRP